MGRTISAAVVQMDVTPQPLSLRLDRADELISEAVQLGAELVVLPELFNLGYAYTKENYGRAEPPDGCTTHWMKRTARSLGVHLAGSLLLIEDGEIFNAMLLVAPDGRTWRYDKSYPWAWERAYFRPNRASGTARATVAHTDLGDLGMLICWDVAHPALWQMYAGQVDLMVVCSCPPQVSQPTYHFPDGNHISADRLGPLMGTMHRSEYIVFEDMLAQQAAWLDVPVVQSVGCGSVDTFIPNATSSLMALLPSAPWLARYLPQAHQMRMSARMTDACQIIAGGQTLARARQEQGETFVMAEVPLAEQKPSPNTPQPTRKPPPAAYWISDTLIAKLVEPIYREGIKTLR